MKRAQNFILLILFTLNASWSWAWPPTYGAEFEIGTAGLAIAGKNFDYKTYPPGESLEKREQMEYVAHMRERCVSLGCKVVEVAGKWDSDFRVEYADGWWFKISYDPGCIEITFKPSTLATLREKAALINDHIFKTGRDLDMTAPVQKMNHFNMGIRSSFDDSPKEFMKFYIDYANHPELTLGGLGHDIYNAPPLSLLSREQRKVLQNIVQSVNNGDYEKIAQVTQAIQRDVYTKSYFEPWGGADHYQAFGLKHVNKANLDVQDAPFELRSMYAQPDAETFIKIAELMEARVRFLKNSSQPLIYTENSKESFSPEQIKTRLYVYVEESGLKFKDYEFFLRENVSRAEIGALVKKDARVQDRLQAVLDYSDLLLTSPYARKNALEILAHPEAKDHPLVEQIKAQLRKEIAALREKPSSNSWFDALFERKIDNEPAVKILNDFLKNAEAAGSIRSCNKIFEP